MLGAHACPKMSSVPGIPTFLSAAGRGSAERAGMERLAHEFGLRGELDPQWALRPLELVHEADRTVLRHDDPAGEPLERLLGAPMELGRFLRIATSAAEAVAAMHGRGLLHKDIKPEHLVVDAGGRVRLTGFGIASRLPREHQPPDAPEVIAGTLAYMAPEQTGRMNRSIDARSDLYSLGVTFYRMLVGSLPFSAADAMGWVHAHIARRPVPPRERVPVPAVLSALVMKLLAKTAEDRYQTAAGLVADLRRCLAMHEAGAALQDFPLGTQDVPEVLRIPEKLYGRERELATLLAAFERVVSLGAPELVLVSGYSGIGKSSLVHELHKAIVPSSGLFASGKFEQYRRDVPYATLAQAFQGLLRQVLARSAGEVARWRAALRQALGDDGELMVRLVPELALLLGELPTVQELPAQAAQARFRRAFRRLLGAFARPAHPLALFLDDLQWIDAASLDLLTDFATQAEAAHLLLVGAYRDNEVDAAHPLTRSVEAIRGAGVAVGSIVLAPLALRDVGALVADALHGEEHRDGPLPDLVHEKTGGNPFFVIQFLGALAEEKLLAFDPAAGSWRADIERINAKGYTDNVIDLMLGKLGRLGPDTRAALDQLACLGSLARFATLDRIFGAAAGAVHLALWPAVRDGLLLRMPGRYVFVHDRVQEAAYSRIAPERRAELHLGIARALVAGMQAEEVIDVADQFNRATALLVDAAERERVAGLNLRAGRKAKASTAYAAAATYFAAGMELAGEAGWSRCHELTFALCSERAECEYLCGNGDPVATLTATMLAHAGSRRDRAAAYRLRVDLLVMRSEYAEAVAAALECLRLFGIDMPAHPTRAQVDAEYDKVWRALGARSVESLRDLPAMTDPDMQAAMRVLAVLNSPAYFTDANLVRLHLCHMVNLTLAHGISDASPHALALLGRRFAWFDLPPGWRVPRHTDAYRFGKLACDLVDKPGLAASRPKVELSMALTSVWTQPIAAAVDTIRSAHRAALEGGDLTIACYSLHHLLVDLLLRGDSLDEIWRESEHALEFVRKAGFRDVAQIVVAHQRFVQNLRGRTASFSSFGDATFDEAAYEAALPQVRMKLVACVYWIVKQQARFLSGDLAAAREAGRQAEALLWAADGHAHLVDYHFYAALLLCAGWSELAPEARDAERERLDGHLRRLADWAGQGAATFRDRAVLAQAEVARIEGRELEAERLYREAIRLSREQHFVHDEALGNELAARFHAARGFEDFALLHVRKARDAYRRWGAEGKVRQLAQAWPGLGGDEQPAFPTGTIGAPVEQLDLATMVRVSQAVSGEMVLEKMLETIMRTAIEHAGAERGLLLLAQDGTQRIAAEAAVVGETVAVQLCDDEASGERLPAAVLQHVLRTQESVVLDDAVSHGLFSGDPFIRERGVRSLLCLPLVKQTRLIGLLYLENNLAPRVFAPARQAVLKLLASQAAISLENARLYRELAKREARIRRLVDANIIGIFIWDFEGRILDANEAFLRMVGYEGIDPAVHDIRWGDLTPPEWQERETRELVPELKCAGFLQPFEKEYFRRDGSRVPVLVGAATFESGTEGVAFVVDLSERKRAEADARDSERRYHDMQMRLADANRLASIGQLSAAIAHEINQPLAGIVANANTAVRRLDGEAPNVPGAQEAARRLIRDAHRASDVIKRLRALFGNKETATEWVDLNDATREVLAISADALEHGRVKVSADLAPELPLVKGDRVQLQQVIMNLLRNATDAMSAVEDRSRELAIGTRRDEQGDLRLTVRDSGVGLDPARVEQLFEAFYTTKSGGMGVGLSVSRSIIERHHGRLWAEANEGPGATFSFVLPLRGDDSPAA